MQSEEFSLSTDLLMDLLEEGDLLLQALDASLQVQPGQGGIVHILQANTKRSIAAVSKGQR